MLLLPLFLSASNRRKPTRFTGSLSLSSVSCQRSPQQLAVRRRGILTTAALYQQGARCDTYTSELIGISQDSLRVACPAVLEGMFCYPTEPAPHEHTKSRTIDSAR
ncbi:hypothetical protein LZ554_000688 [Drepanopeziza brunnea f. sp. 'monogermtubi']|nr:hypothetical protein LZ554_000688 [Drepanopeziza brunnea f. sp. 'monogermtubi']